MTTTRDRAQLFAVILDYSKGKLFTRMAEDEESLQSAINEDFNEHMRDYMIFDNPAELALALDQIHAVLPPPGADKLPDCCSKNWLIDFETFEAVPQEREGQPCLEIAFAYTCDDCGRRWELRFQHRVTFEVKEEEG